MTEPRRWIVTDTPSNTWIESLDVGPADIHRPAEPAWSIRKSRLRGGLRDGVDLIEVENGRLRFSVVPTRGMGLWQGAIGEHRIGWQAPVNGPVNPAFVNLLERGGLGWLQGFDEWIVRCGLDSNGAPGTDVVIDNNGNPQEMTLTLHGRIANIPAHYAAIEVTPSNPPVLTVRGAVDESMLFSPQLRLETAISTQVGSNRLTIRDRITNFRSVPAELELLYHCNFGPPFLDEGATLTAPVLEVMPRDPRAAEGIDEYRTYRAPTPGFVEQVYWYRLAADRHGNTLAALRNAHGDKAAVLRFNTAELPYFTQWKNTVGASDGYCTGLEPGTNLPNLKRFEREKGRVIVLEPAQTYEATLRFDALTSPDEVAALDAEIADLQSGRRPTVHRTPQPDYSDVAG